MVVYELNNFDATPCCIGIGSLIFIGIILYGVVQKNNTATKAAKAPTIKVIEAASGLAEFRGKAVGNATQISPVSKTKCAYWKVAVFNRDSENNWYPLYVKEFRKPFYVEDDTGKILIDTNQAEMDILKFDQFIGYAKESDSGLLNFKKTILPQQARDFLNYNPELKEECEKKKYLTSILENKELCIREDIIREDQEIRVLGSIVVPSSGSNEMRLEKHILAKGPEDILRISDTTEKRITELIDQLTWIRYRDRTMGAYPGSLNRKPSKFGIIIMFLVGLLLLGIAINWFVSDYLTTTTWKESSANVTVSELVRAPDSEGEDMYQANIQYSYQAFGNEYTGHCCAYSSSNRNSEIGKVDHSPVGGTTKILVDPNNPESSRLKEEVNPGNPLTLIFGGVGFLFVILSINNLKKISPKNSADPVERLKGNDQGWK